jgi:hypothetical protein
LFRGNSPSTKLLSYYTYLICTNTDFFTKSVGKLINDICTSPIKYEINPDKVPKTDDINVNIYNIKEMCTQFLNAIIQTLETIPYLYYTYSKCIYELVEEKFEKVEGELLSPGK